jgi:hypothetical protein
MASLAVLAITLIAPGYLRVRGGPEALYHRGRALLRVGSR